MISCAALDRCSTCAVLLVGGVFIVIERIVKPASRPLRIVVVVHSHILGGMEKHAATLIQGLIKRGHAVAYAGPMDGWLGELLSKQGVPCQNIPMHGMYDVWSAFRLARFSRHFAADLIHGHAQRGARYATWAARWLKLASVATAHSNTAWKWFGSETRLIAVSDAVRQFLLSHGLEAHSLCRIYPGVGDNPRNLEPRRPRIGTTERPLRLGMVARLVPAKGQDLALTALAQVRRHQKAHLVVIGSTETPWAAELNDLAKRLGVDDCVEFIGERDDVPDLMREMDVLLAPSRREALSLTLIEACAAGLAIIASNVGGIPEVVQHEHNGLLFESGDADAMAKAILHLGARPDLRESYGAAGRARYEALFTVSAMLDRTEQVYLEAIRECSWRSQCAEYPS